MIPFDATTRAPGERPCEQSDMHRELLPESFQRDRFVLDEVIADLVKSLPSARVRVGVTEIVSLTNSIDGSISRHLWKDMGAYR